MFVFFTVSHGTCDRLTHPAVISIVRYQDACEEVVCRHLVRHHVPTAYLIAEHYLLLVFTIHSIINCAIVNRFIEFLTSFTTPRSFLLAVKVWRFSRLALRLREEREDLETESQGCWRASSAASRVSGSTVSSLRTKPCST